MKKTFIIIMALVIFSCNKAKESMQDAMTSTIEKAIESKTGVQVELPNADAIENNSAWVTYKADDSVYLKETEKLQAVAIFQKDNDGLSIALQITGEGGKSLMAIISHVPDDFSLPLVGKFAVSNAYDGINPVATLMFMNITENGMTTSAMPFEGELKITKLTKDDIRFEILAKGGEPSDAESPSNWKTLTGKGKVIAPMIQSYGIDKNNVLK